MPNTVPNRPMNGPADATVARTRRFDFEPLDLARDRDVENLVDARVKAAKGTGRLLERALPLPHGRHKQRRRGRVVRLAGERSVKFLERLARPEDLLEIFHVSLEFVKEPGLVENDGPTPERSEEEAQHHRLHDDVGRPKHLEDAGFRSCGGGYVGRIHRGRQPLLAGLTAGHGGGNGIGRGLRRKSAETWAFVGPRKSLDFWPRFKTLIVLTAGYQLTPPLASSEGVRAAKPKARWPRPARAPCARRWRCAKSRWRLPTQIAPSPLS